MLNRLAGHFGVPVEVLLDDTEELPADSPSGGVEEAQMQMVKTKYKAAAGAVDQVAGSPDDRQRAFVRFLSELEQMHQLAERTESDPVQRRKLLDLMIAKWASSPHFLVTTDEERHDELNRGAREHAKKLHEAAARHASKHSGSEDTRGTGTG